MRMKAIRSLIPLAAAVVAAWVSGTAAAADPEASDRAESSFTLRALPEGAETTIVNTTYVVTGTYIPGLPQDAQLVIRQRIETVQVQDEKGTRSTVVHAEAWRLGDDMAGPPLYAIEEEGADGATMFRGEYYIVLGENTDWPYAPQTAYRLGDGTRMFEATVPWATFQTLGDGPPTRHGVFATANLDAVAARVGDPAVAVGVITYATSGDVLQRIEIDAASEDMKYAVNAVEETPSVAWHAADGTMLHENDMVETAGRPGQSLVIDFPFNGLGVSIPLVDDRLAIAEATVSPGLSLKALPVP